LKTDYHADEDQILKISHKKYLTEFGGKWEEVQSTCSELIVNGKLLLLLYNKNQQDALFTSNLLQ